MPLNVNLYRVRVADAERVWAVGAKGTVLETLDGGEHWRKIELGVEKDIHLVLRLKARLHGSYQMV